MKHYHLILLVCLSTGYFGCSKKNDFTIPTTEVNNRANVPKDSNIQAVANFSVNAFCGKYLVSGAQYSIFNNDTIIVTKCGDSAVYFTSLATDASALGSNICCRYSGPNTSSSYWHYSENYFFTAHESKITVGIFFPADKPGTIFISANYYACDGGGSGGITEVKIQ